MPYFNDCSYCLGHYLLENLITKQDALWSQWTTRSAKKCPYENPVYTVANLAIGTSTMWHWSCWADTHHEKQNPDLIKMLVEWYTLFHLIDILLTWHTCQCVTSWVHRFVTCCSWCSWRMWWVTQWPSRRISDCVHFSISVCVWVISYLLYVLNQVGKVSLRGLCLCTCGTLCHSFSLSLSHTMRFVSLNNSAYSISERPYCALLHGAFIMWCNLNVCSYH